MNNLKGLFHFYINASIHVAFAVSALVAVTAWELNINLPWSLALFVFLGTISAYNFIKFALVAGLRHRSLPSPLKAIQLLSALCAIAGAIFMIEQPKNVLIAIAFFGIFALFYVVPFQNKKNLRTLAGIKIFTVGFVWAGVTVALPWCIDYQGLSTQFWLVFLQRFFLVIVWTLPFEIRDLSYDAAQLKTLPQQLGIKNVKRLGILLLIGVLLLEGLKDKVALAHLWSLFAMVILTSIFLMRAQKKQSEYFASFWVESIPIAWMFIYFLLSNYL